MGNNTKDMATILVVDDDDMNLEIISFILSSTYCKVIKAQNGLEALKQLDASSEIDVMLVDLEMPVMDGYEFIMHIKQNLNYRHIPIVVLTGNTDEVTHTLSMGASDFISKPYNREELQMRVMNQVLSKKQSDLSKKNIHESADDSTRLLHELQVHQLELEMQNEELRRTIAEKNELVAHLRNIITLQTEAGNYNGKNSAN